MQQQTEQANAINTKQNMWQNLPETSENKQKPQQNQEQEEEIPYTCKNHTIHYLTIHNNMLSFHQMEEGKKWQKKG